MSLTTNGKNYIADKFGIGGCFVSSGISFTYVAGSTTYNDSGGTAQIVSRLVLTAVVSKVTVGGIDYTYAMLKTANDGVDIDLDADVKGWIVLNDGDPSGEPKYCSGSPSTTPTVPPTATPTPVPPTKVSTFTFMAAPSGIPSLSLDLSQLTMQQNATDRHFEMNGVSLTNTSLYPVYIAIEARLFSGALASCPESGQVFRGMNRTSGISRGTRIYLLNPAEFAKYNLDFYQPASILGVHTVCIYAHATYDRDDLEAEIANITG